ncbi:MAG: VanZ family protein [Opitutaceae bacterium]|nr:VanZ family protein [Opitutaceae bacterium]
MKWVWPLWLAATIFIASGRGAVVAPDIVDFDKIAHFAIFGLLATLVVRVEPRWRGWLAVLLVSAFGLSDEWHQSFTPGRAVEMQDWVADTLGAIVATRLYLACPRYRRWLETSPIKSTG